MNDEDQMKARLNNGESIEGPFRKVQTESCRFISLFVRREFRQSNDFFQLEKKTIHHQGKINKQILSLTDT